jgi:hypothetical protein
MEVKQLAATRNHVNNCHRRRLESIYRLQGFTGSCPEYEDSGVAEEEGPGVELPLADEDDVLNDEMIHLSECMDNIIA